jgi:hypothetical protein
MTVCSPGSMKPLLPKSSTRSEPDRPRCHCHRIDLWPSTAAAAAAEPRTALPHPRIVDRKEIVQLGLLSAAEETAAAPAAAAGKPSDPATVAYDDRETRSAPESSPRSAWRKASCSRSRWI